jgi:Flp pilus assembly pilin Flp
MNRIRTVWLVFQADESGQDLIEYALIIVLIALGAVTGLKGLAGSLGRFFPELVARFYALYAA